MLATPGITQRMTMQVGCEFVHLISNLNPGSARPLYRVYEPAHGTTGNLFVRQLAKASNVLLHVDSRKPDNLY